MFTALRGRIALYALNATGVFLIMQQNREEPDINRRILGFVLIGIGTLGILAINFWPHGKKNSDSADTETEDDDETTA
jgi:hypothetical protein